MTSKNSRVQQKSSSTYVLLKFEFGWCLVCMCVSLILLFSLKIFANKHLQNFRAPSRKVRTVFLIGIVLSRFFCSVCISKHCTVEHLLTERKPPWLNAKTFCVEYPLRASSIAQHHVFNNLVYNIYRGYQS